MEYQHTVHYYETDKMAITHHSNYIRWMEEARVDYLAKIGWDMPKVEAMGIVSPVLNVNCNYKKTTAFADKISIKVSITEFKGVKLGFTYEMKNEAGEIVCTATSSHCFLNTSGKPINVKKLYPDLYKTLNELATNN